MKSIVIASALFASLALAAPVNKRAYATKTNTVVETVVVYTTVWGAPEATEAAPAAISSPALFFENQPSSSAAVVAPVPTPEPAPSSAAPVVPSSTPEPVVPSSTPEPVVESPTPTPEPVTPAPEPTPTPAPVEPPSEPAPVPSSTAPEEPKPTEPSSGGGGGETYAGSFTMNYYGGGVGACGKPIADTDMTVALAVAGFGDSIFDPQTGENINPWCNKKISISFEGKTAEATIMDRCAGCTGAGGLDATPALWEALTGGQGGASGDRIESGMTFSVLG